MVKTRTSPIGKPRAGYTLVEIMVVVAVIAVLVGMALPQVFGAARSSRLRMCANSLFHLTQYARFHAVTHGQACRLVFDRENTTWRLEHEDDTGQYQPLKTTTTKSLHITPPIQVQNLRIGAEQQTPTQTAHATIYFYPDGQADRAALEISDGGQTWYLAIFPHTGRSVLTDTAQPPHIHQRIDLDL